MNRSLVTLAVVLLVSVPAVATSSVSTPGDVAYFGDEPNVHAPGTLPYANHNSDTRMVDYPADSNGVAPARAGWPSVVLAARFYAGDGATQTRLDHGRILQSFTERQFLVGSGAFLAWHGTWADLNGDGYLSHPGLVSREAHVALGDRECGDQQLRADDPAGIFGTAVSYRCDYPVEWIPGSTSTEIVGYITPHVPTEVPPLGSAFKRQTTAPDLVFAPSSANEGGRWYAPKSNFNQVFVDNSILETTVVEIVSHPLTVAEGARSKIPGPSSLVDVDLYVSLDPLLEGIYQSALFLVASEDCDVDHPENTLLQDDCPRLVTSQLPPLPLAHPLGMTYAAAGPTVAQFAPPRDNRLDGKPDFSSEPHVLLATRISYSQYRAAVGYAADFEPYPYAGLSHTGSGAEQAPLYASVFGRFGVWHDKNADGWIGRPARTDPCTDAHECGVYQDPNDYFGGAEMGAYQEWWPFCRPDRRVGEILATVTSSTGAWGPAGVYVVSDRRDVLWNTLDPSNDEYEFDGRIGFNPWDDVVLDVLGLDGSPTGQANRLVTSGPIGLHLVCGLNPGIYASYEKLVFPTSNLGFTVTLQTESFEVDFRNANVGIDEVELVSDTYTLEAWSV